MQRSIFIPAWAPESLESYEDMASCGSRDTSLCQKNDEIGEHTFFDFENLSSLHSLNSHFEWFVDPGIICDRDFVTSAESHTARITYGPKVSIAGACLLLNGAAKFGR